MKRQFTSTAIVMDSRRRVLLHWHKKYQKWMPPGGHMEQDEIPEEAALRECREETGLEVEIMGRDNPDFFEHMPDEGHMLKIPYALLLENIPANEAKGEAAHQHIDFVFIGRPKDETKTPAHQESESDGIRWFTREEVEAMKGEEMFANLKTFLLHVIADASV